MLGDKWSNMYNRDSDIYEAFSAAEDYYDSTWDRLRAHVDFSHKTVFEMGCGTGKYTSKIASIAKKVYANDISKLMLNKASHNCRGYSNIEYILASAENNNLPDNTADIVFSAWGYVAGNNEFSAILEKEFCRLLNPNGEVWLLDNYYQGEFNELRGKKTNHHFAEEELGYELVEIISTVFVFNSPREAASIMGYILGDSVEKYILKNNKKEIKDKVALLRKRY